MDVSSTGCDPWEFRCDNSECVRGSGRCNGMPDCGDGSDEKHCPTVPPSHTVTRRACSDGQFCCANGRSIYSAWHCDGDADCLDGSDEENCPTTAPRPLPTTTITIGVTASAGAIVIFLSCIYFFYHRRKHPRPPSICLPAQPPDRAFSPSSPPQYRVHNSLSFPRAAVVNLSFTYNNMGRPPPLYTSHVDISDMSAPYDCVIEPPPEYEASPSSCGRSEVEYGQQHVAGRQTQGTPLSIDDSEKQCVSGVTNAGH
ncbi:hypothetical protein LSAT2_023792 [Lamellibrachia satsuma]|nr:hypothetical protein LSAT2_023792 [Lamellibrachia satsuma]